VRDTHDKRRRAEEAPHCARPSAVVFIMQQRTNRIPFVTITCTHGYGRTERISIPLRRVRMNRESVHLRRRLSSSFHRDTIALCDVVGLGGRHRDWPNHMRPSCFPISLSFSMNTFYIRFTCDNVIYTINDWNDSCKRIIRIIFRREIHIDWFVGLLVIVSE